MSNLFKSFLIGAGILLYPITTIILTVAVHPLFILLLAIPAFIFVATIIGLVARL